MSRRNFSPKANAHARQHSYPPSKNRVWNFFGETHSRTSGSWSQGVEPHREINPDATTTAQDVEYTALYYGYRFYSPELGRWVNRDPLLSSAMVRLDEVFPDERSAQSFVLNDSINSTDDLGLMLTDGPTLARCFRCGPDVTKYLDDQMKSNPISEMGKRIRKYNWLAVSMAGNPVMAALYRAKAYALWIEMVGYDKDWDFKAPLERMFKDGGVDCSDGGTCPGPGCADTTTLCGKCTSYDAMANIHFGHVERKLGFTIGELLTGSTIAQKKKRGEWDPPEDKALIRIGWEVKKKGLCPAFLAKTSELKMFPKCSACPTSWAAP